MIKRILVLLVLIVILGLGVLDVLGTGAFDGAGALRASYDVGRDVTVLEGDVGGDGTAIHWDFLRTLYVSVADTVIVPLQDVLGLGSETRMNLPGRPDGNWRWRFDARALTPVLRERLRSLAAVSGSGISTAPAISPMVACSRPRSTPRATTKIDSDMNNVWHSATSRQSPVKRLKFSLTAVALAPANTPVALLTT